MLRKSGDFLGMFAGACFLAISVNLFYKPAALFAGGVPGLSIIILNFLGQEFYDYLGYIIFCISVLFFAVQWKYLGKKLVLKASLTSMIFIALVQLSNDVTKSVHISDNLILMAVGGSILAGMGISLIIMNGYSFIGTIGLAQIITKKFELPPGKSVLYVESVVIIIGSMVIGVEQAMISAIALYILTRTVDSMTFGMHQYKQLVIVSPRLDEIRLRLTAEVSENASIILAENAARSEEQNLLMVFIRFDQFKQARDIIRHYDPHAFVITSDVTEMIGEGFRTL